MRVVVTGANGFIGRAIAWELAKRGHQVVGFIRDRSVLVGDDATDFADLVSMGPLEALGDLSGAMRGVDAVVHTANWAGTPSRATTAAYVERVNVLATRRLCEQAARSDVGHFIYLSSSKAIGDRTTTAPFCETTEPHPSDLYGQSKLRAERALSMKQNMRVSIIRPPPVYGPGMKGGLLTLFKLAQRGMPLPLKSIHNQRDYLSVPSLADLVARCIERPPAGTGHDLRIFMARDGEPVSTGDLYSRIAQSLGGDARVWPFPVLPMKALALIPGLRSRTDSLVNSLRIDDSETRKMLDWLPVCTLAEGLALTASWYVKQPR